MWHKEIYFNRRDWLIQYYHRLNINANQLLLLLTIDAQNQLNNDITHDSLKILLNCTQQQIDKDMQVLIEKNYLKIKPYKKKIDFNIDAVFKKEFEETQDGNELLLLFEDSFGRLLSQQELLVLTRLKESVEPDKILYALRQAMINSKLSMSYVEKVALSESK